MKFFSLLTTLALSFTAETSAQQAVRKMRASVIVGGAGAGAGAGGRHQGQQQHEELTSLSFPMIPSEFVTSGISSSEIDPFQQRSLFEKTVLGAAIAKWNQDAATNNATSTMPSSSSSSGTSSAGTSSMRGRSSKSAKTCDARLKMAKEAIEALPGTSAVSPEDITAACTFRSGLNLSGDPNSPVPVIQDPTPNLDCPAPAIGYFFEDSTYDGFFAPPYNKAMLQFTKYCECHQGYELDCINKIAYPEYESGPRSGTDFVYPGDTGTKKWKEYCKFVGIWNGDIDYAEYDKLSSDVQQCGCYFVTSYAKDMVDSCPGVFLFQFLQV
jgi:hypothetical protein